MTEKSKQDVIAAYFGNILGRLVTLEKALTDKGLLDIADLLAAERSAVDDPHCIEAVMLVARNRSEAREFLSVRTNLLDPDEEILFRQSRESEA